MAKIHYCRCRINLAGQNCHTVVYDEFNAISWPEVQVLMALHGDENVMDIMPVKIDEAIPAREKERLASIYTYKVVEAAFPGRQFRMNMMMTNDEDLPHASAPLPPDVHSEDEGINDLVATPPVFKPGRERRHEAPRG